MKVDRYWGQPEIAVAPRPVVPQARKQINQKKFIFEKLTEYFYLIGVIGR